MNEAFEGERCSLHFHEGPSFCGRREDKDHSTVQCATGPNRHDETANNLQVKVKTDTGSRQQNDI